MTRNKNSIPNNKETAKQEREARIAKALRANLRRRKQAARKTK